MASCSPSCPPKISASELRHPVAVQAVTRTGTPTGGTSEAWATVAVIWMAVKALSGNEVLRRAKLNEETTHEFKARWPSVASLTTQHRLVYKARNYDILFIDNIDEYSVVAKIRCKYGDPP